MRKPLKIIAELTRFEGLINAHQRLAFNLYMHLSASAPPNNCPIISALLPHLLLP